MTRQPGEPCPDCEGTGFGPCACCGDGHTECACDDGPEETECDSCEGTGVNTSDGEEESDGETELNDQDD